MRKPFLNHLFKSGLVVCFSIHTLFAQTENDYTYNRKSAAPIDFQLAAETATKAVVHVKVSTSAKTVYAQNPFGNGFFEQFFGPQQYVLPPQSGSGSGVLIDQDGHIVTNYHVIANAEKITVTLSDGTSKQAKLIGTDMATDLAVLKVEENNLSYLKFSNSDQVKLGQWVLAIGYPLNLDVTVTAGIVSAKSRNIGIHKNQQNAIESFIQTDAAVNPGNSGGALVNSNGDLVGINAAISSPTGSYAGYSYAIPSNIVKKVSADLIQYGKVQRAFLGINPKDIKTASEEEIKKYHLDQIQGVAIVGLSKNGAAEQAGLKIGDLIQAINQVKVNSVPSLLEQIARYHPKDEVEISYWRDGQSKTSTVILKSNAETTGQKELFGASYRFLSLQEKKQYGINNGLIITDLGNGPLAQQSNIQKGFIITAINDVAIATEEQIANAINNKNFIQIAGFYPGQIGNYYYSFQINE